MNYPIYQVDAFTQTLFCGNPAAVMPLDSWLPDATLQSIAAENNLAETAYFVPVEGDDADNDFHLRWFTPGKEMDLCGHATLASAYVIFTQLGWKQDRIRFASQSGTLVVTRSDKGLTMDFPSRPPVEAELPQGILNSLNIQAVQYAGHARDWLIEVESEAAVKAVVADFSELAKHTKRAVIVTAKGDTVDFVSRFFAPEYGVDEDPVTGSAHCTSVPYWAAKLDKTAMQARQISARGGELFCELKGDRVFMSGECVLYLQGEITL